MPCLFLATLIHASLPTWPKGCTFPFSIWRPGIAVSTLTSRKRSTDGSLITLPISILFILSMPADTLFLKVFLTDASTSLALRCSKSSNYYKPKIESSTILQQLGLISTITLNAEPVTSQQSSINKYFLVSTHREENVDNPENLKKILLILNRLAEDYKVPVIVSTHPRTRKRLVDYG